MSGHNWRVEKRATTGWTVWRKLGEYGDSQLARGISERDAKLIASAPALLDALTELLDFHNEGRVPTADALNRAESAIALAEQEGK